MRIDTNAHFVVDPTGHVGLAIGESDECVLVQYGPNGPFKSISPESLCHASEQDVIDAGLWGVGSKFAEDKPTMRVKKRMGGELT